MEKEYKLTQEQFDNLIKLSNIEIAADTQENVEELISRAIIGIERKLNYFNTPLSFFTAEVTNVLIVDDTELSIFQLSVMLEKIGMNVYVARNKEEAYAEFKKKNFDFLVMDLYLPDYQDGFELIKEANLIVFALYPHVFVEWIKQNGHLIQPKTVITDVTGVKECIVYDIQAMLPDGVEFIAAHPMAGKETAGVEYADEKIFRNANYIVVPTEKNSLDTVELCGDLGETLGFREISVLSPKKHDQMIAFLSQLTHCIAVSLMCACDAPDLERYTGDSFRDLTRIANINDEMWSELFLSNRETLLSEMDNYRESFEKLYNTIKNGDREEMREMMRLSTARRKKFDKKA